MKPNLSIILPSIRPYNLERLYNSILEATCDSFELVIVSPYDLPPELKHYTNIKIFRDYGSPVRASNIAGCLCEGDYITYAADDGVYLPNSIDLALEKLKEVKKKYYYLSDVPVESCISCKYMEGNEGSFSVEKQSDALYKLCNAYPNTPLINPDWNILNVGFMEHRLFSDYGGWDNDFEACPMAHADLAARMQYHGVHIELVDLQVLKCEHLPGTSGDHGPICIAQTQSDTPKYIKKWSDPYFIQNGDLLDWKEYPSIWTRRFANANM